MRPPSLGPYSEAELNATNERNRVVYSMNDLRNIITSLGGTPQGRTKAGFINQIMDLQQQQNILPLGPVDYDRALIAVVSGTPIVYEIDLPGIHPLPIGWPEPMIFSMMEMLAKHKDHITGLNGSSYDPDEFLSPKISSHFRIDEEAEIDITYYDISIGRNRRFALSYEQLRDIAECTPEDIDMNTTARYATAMSAFFSQIAGLGNTPKSQQDIEALQRVMASASIVTSSNNTGQGVDSEYFGTDENDFDPANDHDFSAIMALYPTLRGLPLESTDYNLFPDPSRNDGASLNGVATQEEMRLLRAMIIKQLANLFLPDFMRIAHQNGTAMFNLDVDVSQGLSSLFILREIVKHSKSAYNYTPSDDDITFTYVLMVWCLENCLGAGQQQEEVESFEKFASRMFQNVFSRNEERNEQIAGELMNLIQAGGLDPAVEEALIEFILNDMGEGA